MDVPESNDITATSIQSPMVLLNDLIEENAPLVTCKKKKKNILRDKKKSLKRDRDARRIMETSTDQPPTEESVLSDTITNIDNSIDEMDSGEEDHPGLIKLKPPRPPRKKVKETLKEPLYEEDIIEGFSFAAFSTYEDLEKMAKWSSQHNGKYPDPYAKLKFDNEKKKEKKKKKQKREKENVLAQIDPNANKGSSGSSSEKGYICDSDSDGEKAGSDNGVGDLFSATRKQLQNGLPSSGPQQPLVKKSSSVPSSGSESSTLTTSSATQIATAPSAALASSTPKPKGFFRPYSTSPTPPKEQAASAAAPPVPPYHPAYRSPAVSNGFIPPMGVQPPVGGFLRSTLDHGRFPLGAFGAPDYNPFFPYPSRTIPDAYRSLYPGLVPPSNAGVTPFHPPSDQPKTTVPCSTSTSTVPSSHQDLSCRTTHPSSAPSKAGLKPSWSSPLPGTPSPSASSVRSSFPSPLGLGTPPAPLTPASTGAPRTPTTVAASAASPMGGAAALARADLLRRELDSRFMAGPLGPIPPPPGTPFLPDIHASSASTSTPTSAATGAVPGASPLIPPAGSFLNPLLKDVPKIGGGPDSMFFRAPGFPSYPPIGASPAIRPPADPLRGVPPPTSFVSPSMQVPPTPKKTGKWNAMHVRIAWEIYNHQQKQKSDNKSTAKSSASSTSSTKSSLSNNQPKTDLATTPKPDLHNVKKSENLATTPTTTSAAPMGSADLLRGGFGMFPPRPMSDPYGMVRPGYGGPMFGPSHLESALSPFPRYGSSAIPFGGLGSMRGPTPLAPPPMSAASGKTDPYGLVRPPGAYPPPPGAIPVSSSAAWPLKSEASVISDRQRREAEERKLREKKLRERERMNRSAVVPTGPDGTLPQYLAQVGNIKSEERRRDASRSPVRSTASGSPGARSTASADLRSVESASVSPLIKRETRPSSAASFHHTSNGLDVKKEDEVSIIGEKPGINDLLNGRKKTELPRCGSAKDHRNPNSRPSSALPSASMARTSSAASDIFSRQQQLASLGANPYGLLPPPPPGFPGLGVYSGALGAAARPGLPPGLPPPPPTPGLPGAASIPGAAPVPGLDPFRDPYLAAAAAAAGLQGAAANPYLKDPLREVREREMMRLANPLGSMMEQERARLASAYPPGFFPPPGVHGAAAASAAAASIYGLTASASKLPPPGAAGSLYPGGFPPPQIPGLPPGMSLASAMNGHAAVSKPS